MINHRIIGLLLLFNMAHELSQREDKLSSKQNATESRFLRKLPQLAEIYLFKYNLITLM